MHFKLKMKHGENWKIKIYLPLHLNSNYQWHDRGDCKNDEDPMLIVHPK